MLSKEIIEELYVKHSKELFIYILKMINQRDLAEDILQESFTKLIDYSIKKQVRLDTARAFLYRIAHNVCINKMKKMSKVTVSSDDIVLTYKDSFVEKLEVAELNKMIYKVLDNVDEESRSIFVLSKENQKSNREIAEILKVSERTVRRKLKRVLEIIAVVLEKAGIKV